MAKGGVFEPCRSTPTAAASPSGTARNSWAAPA